MKKILIIGILLGSNCFGQDLKNEWEIATSRALKGEKLYEMTVVDPGLTETQFISTFDCLNQAVKPVEIVRKGKYIIFYTFLNNEEGQMKLCFPLEIQSLESKELSYSETEQIYISR